MAGEPIRSNNRHHIWIMWAVALLWTVICALLWNKVTETGPLSDRKTGEILLVGLFFSADLFIVGVTSHATWGLLRFGRSLLTLNPDPGAIGGHVGGTIELAYPFPTGLPFIIQLNCIHSRMTGSGKSRSRSESVLWQADDFFTVQNAAGSKHLSFVFEAPSGLPPSEPKHSGDYHLWRLEVTAELDGPDFHRSFDITVEKSEGSLSGIGRESVRSVASLDATLAGIETVANIRPASHGIDAEFPAMGRPAQGVFLILFGLLFSGAGLAVLLGGSLKSGHRTRTYYTIVAKSREGKKLIVAERLEGRREAEFLQETYLGYLGRKSPDARPLNPGKNRG